MTRLWPWLRVVAAVGVLAGLGWRLGSGAFLDGLRAVTAPAVAAALGIGLLTTVLSAWRWCVVARGLGLPLALRAAVADYYRGLLLNAVLPAGVLGDVHRAVDHGTRAGDVARGVRAVVFERCAGQVVLAVVGIAVLSTGPVPDVRLGAVLGVLGVVAVGAVAASRVRKVRELLRRTWADARVALLTGYALPRVIVLSVAVLAGHVALFVVAARVAGSAAPLQQVVPWAVLALLVMAVPVNVGGFGPREAFLAVTFGSAGLGATQGVTTAVVYGVLALVAALPGVFVLLRRSQHRQQLAERTDQARHQVPALVG